MSMTMGSEAGLMGRLGLGVGTPRATGVEAGDGWLRIAQLRDRRTGAWEFTTTPFELDGPGQTGATNGASLQAKGIRRSAAVCSILSRAIEIFPVSIDARSPIADQVVAEANERISHPLDASVLDYVPIPEWALRSGRDGVGAIAFAVPRAVIDALLDELESARLSVQRILTPGCVLAPRLSTPDDENAPRELLVALGEEVSSLSVIESGSVLVERMVDWGVARLARNIAQALELPIDRARRILEETTDGPEIGEEDEAHDRRLRRVVQQILSGELDDLHREAAGCLGFSGSFFRQKTVSRVVLVGPLADSPPLGAFLRRALDLPVVALEGPVEGIGLDRPCDPTYALAASCALWTDEEETS